MKMLIPVLMTASLWAQQPRPFDVVLKGGHVIDPKNGIDHVADVAIRDGTVVQIADSLPDESAQKVISVDGLFVVPGLVDIHTHLFHGTEEDADYSNGFSAISPDSFSFRSGVTTMVDAGGSGWRNFKQFKRQTIDRSQTRVLAFLNIVGNGMKGGPIEQDLSDMDARLTAMRASEFKPLIVGIKVAHYNGAEWDPVDRAVEAGRIAGIPVMIDFGSHQPPLSLRQLLLDHLRPGDFLTHAYADAQGREAIVGGDGTVKPFVREARQRGVLFDVGHGAGSFVWRQVVPAMASDFPPDTISTDLHVHSMNAGMKDLLNVMSKFLNLGMPLQEAVLRTTWAPARVIGHQELGHLSPGAEADITVLNLRRGSFGFIDAEGAMIPGNQKLECELVLRAGHVVWDLNGRAARKWQDPASGRP